jgi:hypothetical protein
MMNGIIRLSGFGMLLLLASCGTPPKSSIPSLNPQQAAELLRYNNKAQNWMKYVHRQNAGCDYRLDLPDQSTHPTSIDLNHIVFCGTRPSPKEFDASVSYVYDQNQGKWIISRFSS